MLSNDDKAVKTSNLFEHLEIEDTNEEIIETNMSRDTDDNIKRRQINGKTRSYRKIKNRRQKSSIHKKVKNKSPVKRNRTMSNIEVKRCHGCHVDHFPLPKFSRWWEKRRFVRTFSVVYNFLLQLVLFLLNKT